MNTHEARTLRPSTRVHWLPPKGVDAPQKEGNAFPNEFEMLRIAWDDIGEPDSLVRFEDRLMLLAIIISEPVQEGDL